MCERSTLVALSEKLNGEIARDVALHMLSLDYRVSILELEQVFKIPARCIQLVIEFSFKKVFDVEKKVCGNSVYYQIVGEKGYLKRNARLRSLSEKEKLKEKVKNKKKEIKYVKKAKVKQVKPSLSAIERMALGLS